MKVRSYLFVFGSLILGLQLVAACSDDGTPSGADARVDQQPASDTGVDAPPATALKVAAVQYSSGNHSAVPSCDDDVCGVAYFIREAAGKGATIITTPEYAQDQSKAELAPAIGDTPADDSRWAETTVIKTYAKLAVELKVTLIFNLIMQEGEGASAKRYNANLAVDAAGKVIARHYKFQLFGNESKQLTPGPSIKDSFFQTPSGLAGMMICADAQCIVTKLNATQDCTTHSIDQIKDYFAKKPKIVFFSSFWTVGGNGIWAALNVQKQVAIDGDVWLVAANNTAGQGKGGAIFKPGGEEVAKHYSDKPAVIYAEIPFAK